MKELKTIGGLYSLMAHFIIPPWEKQSCVLVTKPFPECHTGQNIANCIQQTVRSFEIDMAKVVAVTHDTAANAQCAGEPTSLSFDWENTECAVHKLQLAISVGIEIATIARATSAGRKLVGHFKHSTPATEQLKVRQEQMKVPH